MCDFAKMVFTVPRLCRRFINLPNKMRIYKDIFTGDEMFSDTYKIKLEKEVLYEVYGKLETRRLGDVQIDGANPSAEEADEGTDEAVESGVDIVLNHRLCETGFGDKKQFTVYLKDYMKKIVAKLEENSPDQVDIFKKNINDVMKDILGRFKDLQFFTGESMDADGMIAMMEYRDIDGVSTPILMCFKHGLDEEKF
jgi:hypothetical protein